MEQSASSSRLPACQKGLVYPALVDTVLNANRCPLEATYCSVVTLQSPRIWVNKCQSCFGLACTGTPSCDLQRHSLSVLNLAALPSSTELLALVCSKGEQDTSQNRAKKKSQVLLVSCGCSDTCSWRSSLRKSKPFLLAVAHAARTDAVGMNQVEIIPSSLYLGLLACKKRFAVGVSQHCLETTMSVLERLSPPPSF